MPRRRSKHPYASHDGPIVIPDDRTEKERVYAMDQQFQVREKAHVAITSTLLSSAQQARCVTRKAHSLRRHSRVNVR